MVRRTQQKFYQVLAIAGVVLLVAAGLPAALAAPPGNDSGGGSDKVHRIVVTPSHVILFPGESATFTAIAYREDGSVIPDARIQWNTDNTCEGASQLDRKDATYTADEYEVCRLRASLSGVEGFAWINVEAPTVTRIVVSTNDETPVVGTDVPFTARVLDQRDGTMSATVAWSSNCPGMHATTGVLSAPTLVRTCTATATAGSVSGSLDVTLQPDELERIDVTGPDTMRVRTTETFEVAGFDQHGNDVELAVSSFTFEAPATTGRASACYTDPDTGVEGCASVLIVADGVARIVLTGPETLVAGKLGTYDVAGFDMDGNEVELDEQEIQFRAPTTAGPAVVRYTEDDVTGELPITVTADDLDEVVLDGPKKVAAGATVTYELAGEDQYGNAVELSEDECEYEAPTEVGRATVACTVEDVEGTLAIEIVAAALHRITITGDTILVAGTSADYALEGEDRYGNDVELAQSTLRYRAPTTVGEATVEYEEDGVLGSLDIEVVAGELATFLFRGPTAPVAGTTVTYTLEGEDRYGNDVGIEDDEIEYEVPRTAGPAVVSATVAGITETLDITVVADVLDEIVVLGKTEVVAGETETYALQGFDQYGNDVELEIESLPFRFTRAGLASATYTEGGVVGSLDVTVLAAALDRIEVEGEDSVVAGETATYLVSGYDEFGNDVELPVASVEFRETRAGDHVVSYEHLDVTGEKPVVVHAAASSRIVIEGPTRVVAGEPATYTLRGFDAFDNPTTLATSTLERTWTRAVEQQVCYSEGDASECLVVSVGPAALDELVLDGPLEVVAGTSARYLLTGTDEFGNRVTLTPSSFSFTAPTSTGPARPSITIEGVVGSLDVVVVPDALDEIRATGPASIVAGEDAEYTLTGYDQYGNRVPLETRTLRVTAPTGTGPATFEHSEGGVDLVIRFSVAPAALDRVVLSGPAEVVAGKDDVATVTAYDIYGNTIPDLADTVPFTAPRSAGPASVTYVQDGVRGQFHFTVVADELHSLVVDGPARVTAGSTVTYDVTGRDQYGNLADVSEGACRFTAPRAAGPARVACGSDGLEGGLDVEVVAGALQRITLTGADKVAAGRTEEYALAGYDEFGNDVPLTRASVRYTAPTRVGLATLLFEEAGVIGTLPVRIVAGPLHRVLLTGPETFVAGTTVTFDLAGEDEFGNPVALDETQCDVPLPRVAASFRAECGSNGVTGGIDVVVAPAQLHSIQLVGATSVVAGETLTLELRGFDAFGNRVDLPDATRAFRSETAGRTTVRYETGGIEGTLEVVVAPAALAAIALKGPDNVPAGSVATFVLQGTDAFGNLVTLPDASLAFSRDDAGEHLVTYEHAGITGSKRVRVSEGGANTILITGPRTVVAGETNRYALSASDQFGNPVALTVAHLDERFTVAGPDVVCYSEGDASGCLDVTVDPAAVADVLLEGPAQLVAGKAATYTLRAFDAFGNAIVPTPATLDFTAPTTAGPATIPFGAGGVARTKTIAVVPDVLAEIRASGPASLRAGSGATYALTGFDQHGNAVPLATSSLFVSAPTGAGPASRTHTEGGVSVVIPFTVSPASLSELRVSGPDRITAGEIGTASVRAFDAFGNEIPELARTTQLLAPTTAGPKRFEITVDGVSASLDALILAAAPATVDILNGDLRRVAGDATPVPLRLEARDRFGNLVTLAPGDVTWTLTPDLGSVVDGALRGTTVAGTQTLEARVGGLTDTVSVTTAPASPASARIAPAEIKLIAGRSASFAVGFFDAFGNPTPAPAHEWSLSPTGVVAFDGGSMRVSGLTQGVATLTLRAIGHPATATATVRIVAPEEAVENLDIVLPKAEPRLEAGEPFVFRIVATDASGVPIEGLRPVYSVTNPEQGTISQDGVFTGDKVGVTDVVAKVGTKEARATVRVIPGALRQIEITPASATRSKGESITLTAVPMDSRRNVIPDVPIDWAVQDARMGSIDRDFGDSTTYTAGAPIGASVVRASAGTIFRQAVVYQFITETRAPAGETTRIDAVSLTASVDNVVTTTHVVGLADVERGSRVDLGIGPQASAGVQKASAQMERSARDVTLMVEVQPADENEVVLPQEVDRGHHERRRARALDPAPAVFITVTATEEGERLPSDRLNSLIEELVVEFSVDASYFTRNSFDPASVRLIEWSDGNLVSDSVAATLLTPTPVNGAYHYRAVLTQFSTFAFVASPLVLAKAATPVPGGPLVASSAPVLARIVISGPDPITAGTIASYVLTGIAQDGAVIPLAQTELTLHATTAGTATLRYEERGVVGERRVRVLPGAIESLEVEGPTSLAAGHTGGLRLIGVDAYGNRVDLGTHRITMERAGHHLVTLEHGGRSIGVDVHVAATDLHRIEIQGPDELVAGESARYTLTGYDGLGNVLPLGSAFLEVRAPEKAGVAEVYYEEGPVQAVKAVQVVAGPLATIQVSGPDLLEAGATEEFLLAGFDAYGNPVPLEKDRLAYEAKPGSHETYVCYAERSVSGCHTLRVVEDVEVHRVEPPKNVEAASNTVLSFLLALLGLVACAVGLAGIIVTWRRRRRDDEEQK